LQVRTGIFVAIIVVTFVASLWAEIGFLLSADSNTKDRATISLNPQTTTVSSTQQTTRLYELIFSQTDSCFPPLYYGIWAVTLNNKTTLAEPPWATLPLTEGNETAAAYYKSRSEITFSVPNGIYSYTVYPETFFSGQSGVVTVNGSDSDVQVQRLSIPCPATNSTNRLALVGSPAPCFYLFQNCVAANYASNVNLTVSGIVFVQFYDPQGQTIATLTAGLTLVGEASTTVYAYEVGVPAIPSGVYNISMLAVSVNNEVVSGEQYFVLNYSYS
jgi:hypothetical protein